MRMRKKTNLSNRMERCSDYQILKPEEYKGKWCRLLFPEAEELHVEVGCGKGKFTMQNAEEHPNTLFVAIEKVEDAMIIAMERCKEKELKNVVFISGDVKDLDKFFDQDEVKCVYINFCDPWPGAKTAKRRLTHVNFLNLYRKILVDGGRIEFKSDNDDLFNYSLFQFPKAGYDLQDVTHNLHENGPKGIMTDYEYKFYCQGKTINRCVGIKLHMDEVKEENTENLKTEIIE